MNIRRKLPITNILYLAVAKWPYIFRGNQRQLKFLAIISINKLSIIPFSCTEYLEPWFYWLCKQNLHKDLVCFNIFEDILPYKILRTSLVNYNDIFRQLLPPDAPVSNYTTYLVYGDKMYRQFSNAVFYMTLIGSSTYEILFLNWTFKSAKHNIHFLNFVLLVLDLLFQSNLTCLQL